MLVTLFAVTAIAALALGGVYTVTKEPIELAKRAKMERALGEVLPEFDSIMEYKVMPDNGKDSLTFFDAYDDRKWVGTAIRTYTDQAYGGRFWIMVGLEPGAVVQSTAVLEAKETPGLGDKMYKSKSDWPRQFEDKDLDEFTLKVRKDGGDVDAITAATITSRAFCDAMQRAYNEFKERKEDK